MEHVVIGVDPHKLSATIEVVDDQEHKLGHGRFTTDKAGYAALRTYTKAWPARVWAVEGAGGVGRPLAQRLLADGEQVVDVPAKLAARVRLFDTGAGHKTDAHDAHSIAMVAVRTTGLRQVTVDGELEAMRLIVERRDTLTRRRIQTVDRLQALLAELLPGQAKKNLSTGQAKRMLASVRPRDIAGKTRRRIAVEELAELVAVEAKMKKASAELKAMVLARGSHLMDPYGVGPVVAARVLADVGDVARFATGSRPGPAPHPWTRPPGRTTRTGSPAPGTAGSTTSSTSPPSPSCATTPTAGPTTGASAPRARSPSRRCAASSGASPTPSSASSSPTPRPPGPKAWTRVREGTAGRLMYPARPARTRTPALRISHFPDPRQRRYARPQRL